MISNSQVFFLKKCGLLKCNDKNFNDTLTNDIVSFEQLGSDDYDKGHTIFVQNFK